MYAAQVKKLAQLTPRPQNTRAASSRIRDYAELLTFITGYFQKDIIKNNKPEVARAISVILSALDLESNARLSNGPVAEDKQLFLLRDAMVFLQGLRFKSPSFFTKQCKLLAESLEVNQLVTSVALLKKQTVFLNLPYECKQEFFGLLVMLQDYVSNQYQCQWLFSFPKTINQISVISNWLQALGLPGSNHCDYSRGYTIEDQSSVDADSYHQDLLNFIKKASAYNSAEEQALIYAWLRKSGGQATNGIFSLLTLLGYFTNEGSEKNIFDDRQQLAGPGPAVVGAEHKKANWFINDDNKIELDLQIKVFSLSYRAGKKVDNYILYNPLMLQVEEVSVDTYIEILEALKAKGEKPSTPILSFSLKLELHVVDNQVKPLIKDVTVLSYTTKLLSPARIDEQRMQENLNLSQRTQISK